MHFPGRKKTVLEFFAEQVLLTGILIMLTLASAFQIMYSKRERLYESSDFRRNEERILRRM